MGPAWKRNYIRYKRLFLNFFGQYKERQDVKMFLEVLLSLVTVSMFSLFALRPTIVTIAELIKEIDAKKKTLETMEHKIDNLSRAQIIYDQEKSRIDLLKTAVPKEPLPDSFVRQVEGVSFRNSISLSAMTVEKLTLLGDKKPELITTETGGVSVESSQLGFSINTTAGYQSLLNYLTELENTRRPIKIQNLNISSNITEQGRIIILGIKGSVPYLRDTIQ